MNISSAYTLLEFETLGSTNTYAKEIALYPATKDKTVVLTYNQTAGRGRHGNQWVSKGGNLYTTILLKPEKMSALSAGQMSFVTSLAVFQTLRQFLPETVSVQTKWPNDILVNGKKICGILLESEFMGSFTKFLVIGMGVNLSDKPDLDTATSFTELLGNAIPVEEFLPALIKNFDSLYHLFLKNGFEAIRHEWLSHAAYKGQTIKVRLPEETFHATFLDIDETGQLVVELENGEKRKVSSGEVFF